MTEEEKKLLFNLFDKHELSIFNIINLLGIGAVRTAMYALTTGDEALEHSMIDLNIDCMAFLMENKNE